MGSGEVFSGGATTSQHVEAHDDDHFENTTFQLKRTRSMGLLDEFIQPSTPADGSADSQTEENIPEHLLSGLPQSTSPPTEISSANSPSTSRTDSQEQQTVKAEPTESESYPISPPLVLESPEMMPHDDTDLHEEPSLHVDYLSHQWDVSDISKSWRYITQKRRDVAYLARLENASWRTWAQRRGNLKTISPEAVNWSKESDVTWLYGPIVKDDDHFLSDNEEERDCARKDPRRPTTATSAAAGDLQLARKAPKDIKPILKHRTVEQVIISHLNLLKLQLASNRVKQEEERKRQERQKYMKHRRQLLRDEVPDFNDFDAISDKLNSQYKNSSTSLNKQGQQSGDRKDNATELTDDSQLAKSDDQNLFKSSEMEQTPSKKERHIHFNNEVKQCIALDYYESDESPDEYESDEESFDSSERNSGKFDDEEEDDDDEDDDGEGGFFLRVRSPSSAHSPGISSLIFPNAMSRSETSRSDLNSESIASSTEALSLADSLNSKSLQRLKTIHPLPSTTLNFGSSDEDSDEENPYTSSLSHNIEAGSSRGYDYYYDYNSVYTVDPNHTIYANFNLENQHQPANLVDVPEDITLGSNFDYNEVDASQTAPILDPAVITNGLQLDKCASKPEEQQSTKKPAIVSAAPSALPSSTSKTPFDFSDSGSDSESDDEGGLLISARNSSHSLVQLVFGPNAMTAVESHAPVPVHGQSSNGSGSGLFKQPTSSNSLSALFLGNGSKDVPSALSELFFNSKPSLDDKSSANSIKRSGSSSPSANPTQTQRKSSPLPPHTTSANAFLGNLTPPPPPQTSSGNSTFMFDSESDSDEEFVEDVAQITQERPSYASLANVAGKNGINGTSSENTEGKNNLVGQAKGFANLLLGNWKGESK